MSSDDVTVSVTERDQLTTLPYGERWFIDGFASIPVAGGIVTQLCDMDAGTGGDPGPAGAGHPRHVHAPRHARRGARLAPLSRRPPDGLRLHPG